ncbi:MAG: cytochrome b/b6 domain-containing protein [Bacillota bacterium]
MNRQKETILRFNLPTRLGHGTIVIFSILLFITGSSLIFTSFANLFSNSVLRTFLGIHRFSGIAFTLAPIIFLVLLGWRHTKEWLREIFNWSNEDLKFIAGFPKNFFGFKAETPPQGKFNGGEKLNSILQIFGWVVFITTGWIMYLNIFSATIFGWARVIHSFAALALGGIVIGHAFLGLFHPDSKESINGMLGGYVCKKWAKEHHALWVADIEKKPQTEAKETIGGVAHG